MDTDVRSSTAAPPSKAEAGPAPAAPASEVDGAGPPMSELAKLAFLVSACTIMLISLVDISIVSTAALPIVRDLDPAAGVGRVSWLISAFTLTATLAMPLYGKLSDSYGPGRLYLVALAVFGVGTVACGAAGNLDQLIVFRALQGLGGGGLTSVALIIIALLWPPKKRASRSGVGGGLFAIAAVFGPIAGGPISEYLSWRWIFLLQVPFVVLATVVTLTVLRLPRQHRPQRLDLPGAALFTAAMTALLLAADRLTALGWQAASVRWYALAGLALGVAFVARQATTAQPFLPVAALRTRAVRAVLGLQFASGLALLSLPVFLVTYLNIERGAAPGAVGWQLAPMGAGIFAILLVWGRWLGKLGNFKPLLVVNTFVGAAGLLLFTLLPSGANYWLLAGALFIMGIGMGGVTQMALLATQVSAPPELLGQATTASRFVTTLGTTFGAAGLGTVLTLGLSRADRTAVLARSPGVTDGQWHALTDRYLTASNTVFWVAAAVMLATALLALRMPDIRLAADRPADPTHADSAEPEDPAPTEPAPTEPAPTEPPHRTRRLGPGHRGTRHRHRTLTQLLRTAPRPGLRPARGALASAAGATRQPCGGVVVVTRW